MAVEMQYLPVAQDSDRAGEVNVADKLPRYGKGDVAGNRWNLTRTGVLSTLLSVVIFLLPSFVSARLPRRSSTPANLKPQPLHRTAYLDGLRGVAALVVFLFHVSDTLQPLLTLSVSTVPGAVWAPVKFNLTLSQT